MDVRTGIGLLGTLTIVGLVLVGVRGFVDSYLLGSTELLVPTIATLALTVVVVGTLVAIGARSKQWRENPYW